MSSLLDGIGRPRVLGVLNVTPDSFSDGGRFDRFDAAIAHAEQMWAEGADLIDVGGESTRPGAVRPTTADELDRVVPVVRALTDRGIAVSIDTMRSEVAAAAVDAGAVLVNDVSGGLADQQMHATVARSGAAYVAMHWRAQSTVMQQHTSYPGGVVADVIRELGTQVDAARAAGIATVVADPGLGFSKIAAQNWELLAHLDEFEALGPVLIGASRKSFLGALLDGRPTDEREAAHLVIVTRCAIEGVWGLRVHDVRATRDAIAAVGAWNDAAGSQHG
ncbi:dihydropteroate synthase [Nocardioides baekrokdamisoli]|uniref:Dihydropteroate synthase n=1 Tax=Nocardioides baekrokdamisoli TaxID=1804624 RepID=A0A3G9IP10_9ACTN|nr:dihydropteroate synthase [Nocardioides baekrokdamisoli]BBH17785.1 dihydropteroate synthase [Nocardioides baekrokdamisoli]